MWARSHCARSQLGVGAGCALKAAVISHIRRPGGGTPHSARNLAQRQFLAILKKAELPLNFRLYDLRHSCATLLLVAGENPKVVSERLGHASVVLTLDTYSHVLPTMQEAASQKLERILFG